jgi:hypothetical protein
MSDKGKINKDDTGADDVGTANQKDRRSFLKWGGFGLGALALVGAGNISAFAANPKTDVSAAQATISLGSGDLGIANFSLLLEMLESDFYTRVVANFFSGATAEERQILTDIRDHEIIHREFIRIALGSNGIPQQTFDFSRIDFNNRDSVLTNAQAMEDTGIAAVNGAGQAIVDPNILAALGKIVSVEGRHAAAIRDLRIPRNGYFAPHSEDFALDPLEVLTLVSPYLPIGTVVDASGLPRIIVV